MGWFRSNRRGSGMLALFALAVQFVVAFGHVHLPNDLAASGPAAVARIHHA